MRASVNRNNYTNLHGGRGQSTKPTRMNLAGTSVAWGDRIMRNPQYRPTNSDAVMLDQDALVTILSRHFPGAARAAVTRAAEDVLLLELLARDIGVVWEDAMQDQVDAVTIFDSKPRHES
jgi:hypothetical protein